MVRARGGEQQRLGARVPTVMRRVEQQHADRLRTGRSPGLAGQNDRNSARFERFGEQFGLGGLAHPFPALERDEFSGRHENQPSTPFSIR